MTFTEYTTDNNMSFREYYAGSNESRQEQPWSPSFAPKAGTNDPHEP